MPIFNSPIQSSAFQTLAAEDRRGSRKWVVSFGLILRLKGKTTAEMLSVQHLVLTKIRSKIFSDFASISLCNLIGEHSLMTSRKFNLELLALYKSSYPMPKLHYKYYTNREKFLTFTVDFRKNLLIIFLLVCKNELK